MKLSTIKIEGDVKTKNGVLLDGDIIAKKGAIITGDVRVAAKSGLVNDYNLLINHPSINWIELIGNKTSEELGLEPTIIDITEQDIDNIIFGG